jgi:hypothetical protein
MRTGFPFKRLLLKLPLRFSDRSVIDAAAMFAEQMKLSLAAELIQDVELEWLSEIPGLRELHAWGNEWHPIDRTRWQRELAYSEESLRRIFEAAIRHRVLEATFCARRSAMPLALSDIGSEDIIAIPQPRNPIDTIAQQLDDLSRAAFGTPAAVMLVPPAADPGIGPIAVIAGDQRDLGIRLGIEIAAASHQDLILVPTYAFRGHVVASRAAAIAAGVSARIGESVDPEFGMASVLAHVSRYNAKMLITTRGRGGSEMHRLSEAIGRQRISVLIAGAE